MENVNHFNNLLEKTVNLPEGKLASLDDRVDKIYAAVKAGKPECRVLSMKPQGSWPQETIINPPKDVEFDADFMIELEEVDGWDPSDYNDAIYQVLDEDPVYGDMDAPIEAKNRCIRVTYANDMHVDVVPYVNRADGEHIINTKTNKWEANDSDGFTAWMKERDDLTGGNMRRVIRLLKYLRDHHGWYEDTVSIILTTVVGNTIKAENLLGDADCYSNVPVTLARVVSDLATWVSANNTRPQVEADDTDFTHRWNENKYQQFRTDIEALNNKIDVALQEEDEDESIKKWQDLFGTGFKVEVESTKPTKFPATGGAAGGAAAGGTAAGSGDSGTSHSRSGKAG
jgi:hypothetical protein